MHQVALLSGCIPLLLYLICVSTHKVTFTKHLTHHWPPSQPQQAIALISALWIFAPSRIPQKSPPLSPCSSPRRPPLPLTPPLTPSSLNDGASQGGLPATPTDLDPTSAALWRQKSKHHPQNGPRSSDPDELIGDVTPTDRPYAPSTQSKQPDSKSPLSRYLRLDSLPSRILLISNVPKTVTNEGIKTAFAPYGASKGIWTGHLQSLGIVILAFHDLRHAENACRAVRSGKAHIVLGGVLRAIQLHSGFISVAEARDVGADMVPFMHFPLNTFTAHGQSLSRNRD
ncbi:hypothetical protein EDB86DRAFT_892779 [Lactarius hatsudake]|nr:hypothetical protein EDB86DRAFT_892779 [Lactarius hatsudake]